MDKQQIFNLIENLNAEYFTVRQLYGALQPRSTADKRAIAEVLAECEADCLIVYDRRNARYRKVTGKNFGRAVFEAHSRGFGFLIGGEGGDLFVPASKTNGACHRDEVLFRKLSDNGDEAEVVRVLKRGVSNVVGTYLLRRDGRILLPDDARMPVVSIPPKKDMGAQNGQKAVAHITRYPARSGEKAEGEIAQILGYIQERNVDVMCVAATFGLSQTFPEEVEQEAQTAPERVTEEEFVGRRDLRGKRIFTIDGEDAKDLDDAVSVSLLPDGTFELGVHIADVSRYVAADSATDREAFARGTSVYLPETVFPMLPKQLSNGICSLYEGEDRLALSCVMRIDGEGRRRDFEIFPSVIRSCHRLTYNAAQAVLDGDDGARERYADIADDLLTMERLARILQEKRNKRGNIEFATKEVVFTYDEEGEVADIRLADDGFSHQLIEEFMIAANECVAQYAADCGYPFVYRVHSKPDEQKLNVLFALMRGLGIEVKRTREIRNSTLQQGLMRAKDTPYFNLVNDVMLRTMQKAKYSDVNEGHFGLASQCYCHFTSPIRRYPDLIVHRVLKTALAGKMTEEVFDEYQTVCHTAARQSNEREKTADMAERKADDVKKCAYAQRIAGECFSAVVSGVTERGLFAELPNTVEGFISAEQLGDVSYDPEHFCLRNGSVRYSLGDVVTVRVANVNRRACKIDFDIILPNAKRSAK